MSFCADDRGRRVRFHPRSMSIDERERLAGAVLNIFGVISEVREGYATVKVEISVKVELDRESLQFADCNGCDREMPERGDVFADELVCDSCAGIDSDDVLWRHGHRTRF